MTDRGIRVRETIRHNQKTVCEWVECGGVLGYGYTIDKVVELYIMEKWEAETVMRETGLSDRELCENALRMARYCEDEIALLMA